MKQPNYLGVLPLDIYKRDVQKAQLPAWKCKNRFCRHILTQRGEKKNLIIEMDKYLTRINRFQFSRKTSVLLLAERRMWATTCTASNPHVGETISVGVSDQRDHHCTQVAFTQLRTRLNCTHTKLSCLPCKSVVNQLYSHLLLYMTGKRVWSHNSGESWEHEGMDAGWKFGGQKSVRKSFFFFSFDC